MQSKTGTYLCAISIAVFALNFGFSNQQAAASQANVSVLSTLGAARLSHAHRCKGEEDERVLDAAFLMRTTLPHDRYESELRNAVRTTYRPKKGRREPFRNLSWGQQYRKVVLASRSVNPVTIVCHRQLIAHGRAWGEISHGSYRTERIRLDSETLSDNFEVNAAPFQNRSGTILHEIMHKHGYEHVGHDEPEYNNSMNEITRDTLRSFVSIPALVAPGTLTDSCATMRECRRDGYLVLRDFHFTDNFFNRYLAFDPARRGLGVFGRHPITKDLILIDSTVRGSYIPRAAGFFEAGVMEQIGRSVESRDFTSSAGSDDVVAIDQLLPETPYEEVVISKTRTLSFLQWDGRSDSPNFKEFARINNGAAFELSPDRRWTYARSDRVLGVESVAPQKISLSPSGLSSPSSSLPSPLSGGGASRTIVRDKELVLSKPGHIGYFKMSDNIFSMSAMVKPGDRLRTPLGSEFEIAEGGRALAMGDFNGDGNDDVLFGSRDVLAVISRSASSTRPYAVTWRRTSDVVGWEGDSEVTVAQALDFDGDGRDEILMRTPAGIAVIELNADNMTFRTPFTWNYGAIREGGITVTTRSRIGQPGNYVYDDRDSIPISDAWGVILLSNTSAPGASDWNVELSLHAAPLNYYEGDRATLVDTDGNMAMPTQAFTDVVNVGDHNGDNRDDLALASIAKDAIAFVGPALAPSTRPGTSRTLRIMDHGDHGCSDQTGGCHGELWGHWMIRRGDRFEGALQSENGGPPVILIHNDDGVF